MLIHTDSIAWNAGSLIRAVDMAEVAVARKGAGSDAGDGCRQLVEDAGLAVGIGQQAAAKLVQQDAVHSAVFGVASGHPVGSQCVAARKGCGVQAAEAGRQADGLQPAAAEGMRADAGQACRQADGLQLAARKGRSFNIQAAVGQGVRTAGFAPGVEVQSAAVLAKEDAVHSAVGWVAADHLDRS